MIRRGIPFGAEGGEKGIHFVSYQTSIERQFEFLMGRWMNNPNFPEEGAGADPIAAAPGGAASMALRATTEGGNLVEARIQIPQGLVVPTGGGYFFAPSISALSYLSQDR
jgi:deferrochelatase/peroxidase EfeB